MTDPITPSARAFRAEIERLFPHLTWWGTYNCRHIDGDPTKDWSQHSWGNGVDEHPPTQGYGNMVYAYILAHKAHFRIEHALWNVPFHYDHIHVDFAPNLTGTPPCAGGPPPPGGDMSPNEVIDLIEKHAFAVVARQSGLRPEALREAILTARGYADVAEGDTTPPTQPDRKIGWALARKIK